MNLLMYFYRLSNSPANVIVNKEIKLLALADEVEVSNDHDSDINWDSDINTFKVVKLEAIEE